MHMSSPYGEYFVSFYDSNTIQGFLDSPEHRDQVIFYYEEVPDLHTLKIIRYNEDGRSIIDTIIDNGPREELFNPFLVED